MHTLPGMVVFDLDGTLVDSLRATFQALDAALSPILKRRLEISDLIHHIRRTDTAMLQRLAPEEEYPDALRRYLDYYLTHPGCAPLFPCVPAMLQRLAARRTPLAVVTGRGRASLDILAAQADLKALIPVIIAGDDGPLPKPAPDGVLLAAQRLGVDPAGGWMVGDGPDDIRCGKACGMITVATRWCGLIPEAQIAAACPDHVVDTVSRLEELLGLSRP